jgi:signal peptidase I
MKNEDLLPVLFFETFAKKKPICFVLKGLSMYPVLREGDTLIVKPINFCEAEVGDILAYQHIATKRITVHRMVRREKKPGRNVIFTAPETGRYLIYDQPLIPNEYLISKVITIERGSKKRIDLTNPINILKAKIHAYILTHFYILIRIQRKFYKIIDKLLRQDIRGISYI